MKNASYKARLSEIQDSIKGNLIYSFAELSQPNGRTWAISRKTLERARDAGELLCMSQTRVKGEWLRDWLNKTPIQRREFAQSKLARECKERRAGI